MNRFLSHDILGYDKDNISQKIMDKFNKFLSQYEDLFTVKVVGEKASAAKDLCGWCLAMKIYHEVAKKVAPKQAMVKELGDKLQGAKDVLEKKLSALNLVKQNVAKLKKDSDETVKKKQDLETLADLTKARLERAEKLTGLLEQEGKRWVETVEVLNE
jgi:dynein heavy chain, axonemal